MKHATLTHEDLGRALDAMETAAAKARNEGQVAAQCLAGMRVTLREQSVQLNRLDDQIALMREHLAGLDRWHDDGGSHGR